MIAAHSFKEFAEQQHGANANDPSFFDGSCRLTGSAYNKQSVLVHLRTANKHTENEQLAIRGGLLAWQLTFPVAE